MLHTFTYTRGFVLDINPYIDSLPFNNNLQRLINLRGCPSQPISDCGRNLISCQTKSFVLKLCMVLGYHFPYKSTIIVLT